MVHCMISLGSCLTIVSFAGISFKTQLLYAVVFVTRYLDLFVESSFYRFVMKVFFIGSSVYVLYLMRVRFR
jgi:ER lumen protein retaining receptor